MRTVRLYGKLAKQFTERIDLEVKSPAEAIRALCANFKGFENFLINSESMGIRYKVVTAGSELTLDEIHHPAGGFIDIIPVVKGAGGDNPVGRILIGAALIAAAVFMPASLPAFVGTAIGSIGVSLVLGGVSQLLSPPPSSQDPRERPENTPSTYFNGPVNTTLQGQAVSLAYGRVIVGSAIVSAGIALEQIKAGFREVFTYLTMDVYSNYTETNYDTNPPANTYRIELLEPKTLYDPDGPGGTLPYYRWKWRFHYYTVTLEPL